MAYSSPALSQGFALPKVRCRTLPDGREADFIRCPIPGEAKELSCMQATAKPAPANPSNPQKQLQELDSAVIRFCGDSGDGMQLVGTQFTNVSAAFGNDVSTLPDFPAEIRAPAGTLAGVSGYQLHFSSKDIFTPGDQVDTLVVMNPAALKTNVN